MRTDTQKVIKVTDQMKINDLLYQELQKEYDGLVYEVCEVDNEDFPEAVETLYFPRRILSLLSNQDLPMRCAIGLYSVEDVLKKIAAVKEKYIGESDSDIDIMTMLLELGYKAYAKAKSGTTLGQMFEAVMQNRKGEKRK